MAPLVFRNQRKKRMKGLADYEPGRRCPCVPWQAHLMQIDLFVICCDGCEFHMYSWKRDSGRNASSHGDGPDMSNKAVTDPPSVTTNPLQSSNKFDSVVLLIFGVVMRYGRYVE
ncbi:hypothetical protein T4B_7494 [Trichinella pseudospiralis]|uniref:Uncharacterized protein n=1 Tax=Trichinella pseudospiralis TaxID=6337 RepID=A0A0V1IEQ3_TRIPS|nr:hypothetical protein T4B_7494 [Trichinella pseudospiralis]